MLAHGHGPGEIQKKANTAYRQLTSEQKEGFRKEAEEANSAGATDERISRQRLILKIVANINANVRTPGILYSHFEYDTRWLVQLAIVFDCCASEGVLFIKYWMRPSMINPSTPKASVDNTLRELLNYITSYHT